MNPVQIVFKFFGKKIGHTLTPGTYEARILRTRFNRSGNLEMTLTDVKPLTEATKLK